MEEAKAAAYYEELTRKGEGAARFKQGLGFSSSSSSSSPSSNPVRGSALASSSSSFLSSFVKASSPSSTKPSDLDKQAQLQTIQNKLKKKQSDEEKTLARDSVGRERDRGGRRSSSRERERNSRRRRSRSRDRSGSRRRERSSSRERRRRRSRSRSRSYEERRRRRRSRSRSGSPRPRRSGKSRDYVLKDRRDDKGQKERNGGGDYERLIDGYAEMTQAERIKAKMKLQLSKTVEKDTKKGTGWERFEFNKDAPLDDEEIEAAEDDAALVKNIGQSFRFSAVEARRDEQIRTAHDEAIFGVPTAQSSILTHGDAMFGTPAAQPSVPSDEEPTIVDAIEYNNDKKEVSENCAVTDLLSGKVIAKQQGSWRDRARKLQNGSKS